MNKTEKEIYYEIYKDYPDLLNLEQVCSLLGDVTKKSVYALLRRGDIKAFLIGKRYYIPKIRVLQYLQLIRDEETEIAHLSSASDDNMMMEQGETQTKGEVPV